MTFEQWWQLWSSSGHWHERGRGKHRYVMARFNDKGPYEPGNIKIITNSDNSRESRWRNAGPKPNRIVSDVTRQKLRWASLGNTHSLGFKQSEETKQKRRVLMLGNKYSSGHKNRLGYKASTETKEKCRLSALKRHRREHLKGQPSLLGYKHTSEAKRNMSIAAKKRHAREREEKTK